MNEPNEAIKSAAAALGRRAAGIPKKFSPEELEKRRQQMTAINAERAATGQVAVARGVVKRLAVASGRVRRIPGR
jgi:hypothetical protein